MALNSCADSWHVCAKRVQNGDNGGNERDSSEIEETSPEISRRNFWYNKNFSNFFLSGRFTGSGPEIKTNWHVDNHFLTLSTHWSYQYDDDMLPRCAFETFGTGVPKIIASVIRKIFSATVNRNQIKILLETFHNNADCRGFVIKWYKNSQESNLSIEKPKLTFMKISIILILQLFCNETSARKCQTVNRNQLLKSCMICNQLIQSNFPAAYGSRIKAACITLSRNNCCFSNKYQESRPPEVNSHLLHFLALVWLLFLKFFYLVSSYWIKYDNV